MADEVVLLGFCSLDFWGLWVAWVLGLYGPEVVPHFYHVFHGLVQVFFAVGVPSRCDGFWDVCRSQDVFYAVGMLKKLAQEGW